MEVNRLRAIAMNNAFARSGWYAPNAGQIADNRNITNQQRPNPNRAYVKIGKNVKVRKLGR